MFFKKPDKIFSKPELREEIRKKCKSLTAEDFLREGREASARIWAHQLWQNHSTILAFLSMEDEINTLPLLQLAQLDRKLIFVPKVDGSNLTFYALPPADPALLKKGQFGIREPAADPAQALKPENFPALILTPGLAFDRQGHRLGRGRGCYDRFFAALDSGQLSPDSGSAAGLSYTAIGLCMDCQLAEEVPTEAHDQRMDAVLTGKKLVVPGVG
jgi:5-formyltetrahydrofolate cyclo-ligase